jgi:hypothetical protein
MLSNLEEHTAFTFRMTELVQLDAEVIQRNNCVSCVRLFESVWPAMVTKGEKGDMIVPSQWNLISPRTACFSGFTIHLCGGRVDGDCGVISACSQAVMGVQR